MEGDNITLGSRDSATQNGTSTDEGAAGKLRPSGIVMTFDEASVTFIQPLMTSVHFNLIRSGIPRGLLHMKGGLINDTFGVIGGGVMLFDGTTFTHNQNPVFGGAVSIVMGHAICKDCVFKANRARTIADVSGGEAAVAVLRAGLGGAVLAQHYGKASPRGQRGTSWTLVNCTFVDNRAFQGGAIASQGGDIFVKDCTFRSNSATQNGLDVFATSGGALNITGSSITITSQTVAWQRENATDCLRGEFHDMMEGTCRRCATSTFSLVTPVPTACRSCPANAKVGGMVGLQRLTSTVHAVNHATLID